MGAVVAAAAVHLVGRTAGDLVASNATPTAPGNDWPICTTMDTLGSEADWAELDADFAAGKRALAAGEWNAAITAFKLAALREPGNADIPNYVGYAHRQLRESEAALAHFQQAIALNPRHRGAHQHLGEFYLATGNLTEAQAHLAELDRICLIPCTERADLEKAIAASGSAAAR